MRKVPLDDKGDAVMVTATLLLSIALAVGGRLLLDYGEVQGKELDMEHVADVEDSILRTRAGMLTLLRNEDQQTSITTRLTLGTPGNPYLAVARSSGTLDYSPDPTLFQLRTIVKNGGTETVLNTLNGVLKYSSNNFYYHDQEISFQAGAVMLKEYGPIVVSSAPSVEYSEMGTDWGLTMMLYGFTGEAWTVSGTESIPLSTRLISFSSTDVVPGPGDVLTIRVNTIGEEAWADHFRSILTENGLREDIDFRILTPASFTDPAQSLDIDLLTPGFVSILYGEMEVTV